MNPSVILTSPWTRWTRFGGSDGTWRLPSGCVAAQQCSHHASVEEAVGLQTGIFVMSLTPGGVVKSMNCSTSPLIVLAMRNLEFAAHVDRYHGHF
jgi:hypothetical protein